MSKYDYFVAGRWRKKDEIDTIVAKLRGSGKSVYYFAENHYDGDGVQFDTVTSTDPEADMAAFEQIDDWQTNPTIRKIFEADIQAQRDADAFIIILPAGLSAHMELGAAYGMGKKCYAIGEPEKPESLYMMLDGIYPDVNAFLEAEVRQPV